MPARRRTKPGANAEAWKVGKLSDGDFVGDLETELEIGRHLGHQTIEILFARENAFDFSAFLLAALAAVHWKLYHCFMPEFCGYGSRWLSEQPNRPTMGARPP